MPIGSENVLQEFLVRFGFRMDQMSANAALQSMGSVGGRLNAIARVGVMAFRAVSGEIYRTAMDMGRLSATAERIGMSAGTLDRLLMAASAAGSTEADALRSITQLQGMIGDAALRLGRGANVFRMFGINVYDINGKLRTTESILQEIAVRFRGIGGDRLMDPRVRNTLAKQFGISEDFARVLAGDFGEMLELTYKIGEAFNYNMDRMAAKARLFRREISLTQNILTIIRRSLVGEGIDYINARLYRINRLIAEHADNLRVWGKAIVWVIKLVFAAIETILTTVIYILSLIGYILNAMGPVGTAIATLSVLFGMLAVAILTFTGTVGIPLMIVTAKFLAIAGAVLAVGLALEDLISFLRGEGSLIGDFFNRSSTSEGIKLREYVEEQHRNDSQSRLGKWLNDSGWDFLLGRNNDKKVASNEFDSLSEAWGKFKDYWANRKTIEDYRLDKPLLVTWGDKFTEYLRENKDRFNLLAKITDYFKQGAQEAAEREAKIEAIRNSISEGFKKAIDSAKESIRNIINFLGDKFNQLLDALSIRNLIEAIKEALFMQEGTDNVISEKPSTGSGWGKTITDTTNKLREWLQVKAVDKKYGNMEDGTPYSKWVGTWYYNRKGQKQKFGYNFSDEAIDDDKFFAENAHDEDFLDATLVPKDQIPVSESLGIDVNEPATSEDEETLPEGTIVGDDGGEDPVAFNPFGKNPQLMADTSKVVNTNVSAPQNISVHNNFTIDGAKDAHLVANEVISNQYRVMTNVASILRPLPTTMV